MDDAMSDEMQFPEADLARFADGSLPASLRAEVQAALGASPELRSALAEQERAVRMLRAADVGAPDSLRMQIQAMTEAASARRRRPRLRLRVLLPGATALAAVAAAAIAFGGGGSAPGPNLLQTARLALAPPTMAAPAEDLAHQDRLGVAVEGISFPYWDHTIGWRTLGRRSDTLAGRRIVTVFYEGHAGSQVGYTIVPGSPVPVGGGRTVEFDRVRFTLLAEGQARLVTWLRAGHTCVIAGRSVGYKTLLTLATTDIHGPAAS